MSKIEKVVALLVFLFFLRIGAVTVILLKADAYCFEKGFPKSVINWKFDAYCVGYGGVVKPVIHRVGSKQERK